MEKKELPEWAYVVIFLIGLAIIVPLTSCTPRRLVSQPSPVVVVSPIVQNNLDFLYFAIADRGGLEAWFCMIGFHDKKTGNLLVQGITPVWIDSANGSAMVGRPATCPQQITIGTVHFHPNEGYCELSSVDINTAHHLPFPAVAIVCKEGGKQKILIVLRKEFDEMWGKLSFDPSTRPFSFTPIYRYRR